MPGSNPIAPQPAESGGGEIILPQGTRGPHVWPELDDPRTEAAWLRHMAGRSNEERAAMQWELWFKDGNTGRSKHMGPLDAAEIGEEKALHISRLMRAADFANLPEEVGSFVFDANEYRITAHDAEWHHAVHWNSFHATPALKELFQAIEALGTWLPER